MNPTDQELLYWVNEDDEVIGSCRRGDAHRQGLRHRAVHILVFNSAGELFLQKRSMSKDINPGLWDTSSAGHVDFGESYDACASRELAEELGIPFTVAPEWLFKIAASESTGWEFVQVYRIEYDGPLRLHPDEITEGRWIAPNRLDILMAESPTWFTTSLQALWRRFRSHS